ncbi:MAG: AAA family ATPase [Patescibacteria group bacterium]
MLKKKIISITGTLGSGKSSTADLVAKKLGFKRFSAGDFTRKIALEMGISLNELSKKEEEDKSIDLRVDEELTKAGETEKSVIDARMAFHFIPNSFKVYLELPPEIAKGRILKNITENPLRQQSEDAKTPEEVYEKIIQRLNSEKKRYTEYYNIDHTDKTKFDLVINTNENSLEKVADTIVSSYKDWIAG